MHIYTVLQRDFHVRSRDVRVHALRGVYNVCMYVYVRGKSARGCDDFGLICKLQRARAVR